MNSRHTHIVLMALMLTIFFCIVALYFYINTAVHKSTDRAILARDIAVVEYSDKNQENDLLKIYTETADDRATLKEFFVSDTEIIPFVESLEALGPVSGSSLKITALESEDQSGLKKGTLTSLRAKVDVTGSWSSVMRALKLSETLPYDISISGVRFVQGGSTDDKSKTAWSASYDIKVTMIKD